MYEASNKHNIRPSLPAYGKQSNTHEYAFQHDKISFLEDVIFSEKTICKKNENICFLK